MSASNRCQNRFGVPPTPEVDGVSPPRPGLGGWAWILVPWRTMKPKPSWPPGAGTSGATSTDIRAAKERASPWPWQGSHDACESVDCAFPGVYGWAGGEKKWGQAPGAV
ncbi:hypothetical protein ACHAWF_018778 [Thalassiosira exigua]